MREIWTISYASNKSREAELFIHVYLIKEIIYYDKKKFCHEIRFPFIWDTLYIVFSGKVDGKLVTYCKIKGEVHPGIKLVLIKAEKWEKHISEGLTKIRQRIKKLWIFEVQILWRPLRAAHPYVVYCKFP